MPVFTVPDEDFAEFNPCHVPAGSAAGGQFTSRSSGVCSGGSVVPTARRGSTVVDDIEEAITRILKGEIVELREVRSVNTVLTKLAAMAADALARGEQAPTYDLCRVSVRGTNLFCVGGLRTERYPNGVPRIEMPQFKGKPLPGTPADKVLKNKNGNIDGAPAFIRHLTKLGIRSETDRTMPAARLKASQAQLVGPTVAGMMANSRYDPGKEPIFISRDNYVIDDHHRWAAVVGRDAADGRLGQSRMNVIRIDAPMSEVLLIAQDWVKAFGIQGKEGD